MKTTLVIDDGVMRRLKAEAARRKRTMSQLVESALRRFLDSIDAPPLDELPALPSFASGGAFVDVSNREALYSTMEER
ncbi:MAG: ribbon-helix-helix protein, CopG family [Gemmatimonadota bacterium]